MVSSGLILYIGGYGRSGSTYLERILANKLNAVALGEAVFFPRAIRLHQTCSCGAQPMRCVVWEQATQALVLSDQYKNKSSFAEDSVFALGSPLSAKYVDIQKKIFSRISERIYLDSSKSCRKAMLRPLSLDKIFPNKVYFIWLHRSLRDTITQSLSKGTNHSLESGKSNAFNVFIVLRGVIGYLTANAICAILTNTLFRDRSIYIRNNDLRENPGQVLDAICDRFSLASCVPRAQHLLGGCIHQIAGNRNRIRASSPPLA